ncbi:DUF4349 domain-containing protein, partial [Streptomyces sp. CRN 30]|uniref:DUF4349 domain-containing protein n=1 Tax=Streptomyces sp. CRN 30 TaxID=3075613 RepID=UPI002A7FAF21
MRTHRSARPVPALAALLLAAALALTGCSAGDGASDSGGDKGAAAGSGAQAPADGAQEEAGGAKEEAGGAEGPEGSRATAPSETDAAHIIRTASLDVRVKDVSKALDRARTAAGTAGGYVGDETTERDEDGREHTRAVLRVPADSYQELLDALAGTGELLARSAKAQDVTDQVVDVESRIASQRASVARVRELMDRATRLSDVVTLESELSTRQAELESLLARQASLKDRTELATITLTLSEPPVRAADDEEEPTGFTDALAGGWDAFVATLRGISVVLGAVLPFAAVAALLALVCYGYANAIASLLQFMLIQSNTPDHLLGRVNSLGTAQDVTGDSIGALGLGVLGR